MMWLHPPIDLPNMVLPARIPPQHVPVLTDAVHAPDSAVPPTEAVDAIVRTIMERLRPQIEVQVREALLRETLLREAASPRPTSTV